MARKKGEPPENIVTLLGELTESNCDILIDSLLTPSLKPLYILLNSEGGDGDACDLILKLIESGDRPVYTINAGTCNSSAFYIFIAGTKRFAYPDTSFTLHGTQYEGMIIGANDVDRERRKIKRDLKLDLDRLEKYTKKSRRALTYALKKDTYISLSEAMYKWGIVDKIITTWEDLK